MNRTSPYLGLEEVIKKIRLWHKDFGYRRIYGELKKMTILINKKGAKNCIKARPTSFLLYQQAKEV